jgi:hypothetical protein
MGGLEEAEDGPEELRNGGTEEGGREEGRKEEAAGVT